MVGGAAGDHEHLVHVAQILIGQPLLVEHDPATLEVTEQGVGDGARLLGDLLEHEEVVAALLRRREIPVDVKRLAGAGVSVEVGDLVGVGGDHHHLVLAEFHGVAGVLDERGHIGADEHLVGAHADHQRGGAAGGDDGAGVIGVGEDQRERTFEAAQRRVGTRDEIPRRRTARVLALQEVHRGFGVGIRGELDAGLLELGPQDGVVLDDAVVDNRDLAVGARVGVGVAVGGLAVGGPPRVPHAGGPGQRLAAHGRDLLVQVLQPAGPLLYRGMALTVEDGDPCRVVAAVLHPPQRLDDDVQGITLPDVSDDSAHS